MTQTARLALPLLAAAQSQKHVTHNEAFAALDALVHLAVAERGRNAPPSAPDEGVRYLVGAAPSGAFAGQADALAVFEAGAWSFYTPRPGWTAWVEDEGRGVVFDGSAWVAADHLVRHLDAVESFGLGTAPDADNPFAARLNAALFTARDAASGGTGDLRLVCNKEMGGDTASLLLQSAYSGRAEIGLAGDEDLSVKVSPDGSSWTEALRVDRSSGRLASGGLSLARAAGGALSIDTGADAACVLLQRSGVTVGSIAVTTTGAAYNTVSDARLKVDFQPLDGAGEIVDRLVVGSFGWADKPDAPREIGLLAQQAAAILPQAVSAGDTDLHARQGDPDFRPWSVDYGRLVPVLLAEMRDLRRRLLALERQP